MKLILSLFLFLILCFSQSVDKLYLNNPNYIGTKELHKSYKMKKADIVFLGNSITHGGNWNELLGKENVAERGIPGDIIQGFLARLDMIIELNPDYCFIMGGVNDIFSGINYNMILSDYKKLLKKLINNDITPVVQSTLFAGKNWPNSSEKNKIIIKLNDDLRKFCKDNKIKFIELNDKLKNGNFLNEKYTIDGIHLNWKAYIIWADEIVKYLRKERFKR